MDISKKLRFQIFKRDNFTCQYCGKNPADHNVILEIDHAISKFDGGDSDEENLITSCFDCNRGKSKDSIVLKNEVDIKQSLKNAQEQLSQVKAMSKLREIKKEIEDEKWSWIDDFVGCYTSELRKKLKKTIQRETKKGTEREMLVEVIEITCNRFEREDEFLTDSFFKYFHGVLHNKKNPILFRMKMYWKNQPNGTGYLPFGFLERKLKTRSEEEIINIMDEAKGCWKPLKELLDKPTS